MRVKGTLTVEAETGAICFHDEKGRCVFQLEGLPRPIRNPRKIAVRLGGFRSRQGALDVTKVIEMAEKKMSVLEIARTLHIDGRRVSGIVANARRRGALPPNGPKEWSPRKQYPKMK